MATGIRKRGNSYEAAIYLKRERRKVRKTFPTLAAARAWRAEAGAMAAKGGLRIPKPTTVRQAWTAWHEGAGAGTIRNRSGGIYKPSALRSYERAMRLRVLREFGGVKLADLRRPDLQQFVYRLSADGLDASTIGGTLMPLRAIFRHAAAVGDLAINPCDGLHLPAVRGKRDRIASPQEADALIVALPRCDRAIWATAMYAGLRVGELQALRLQDVDLASGVIRVERGWDQVEGVIELKSNAGRRKVPIAAILRDYLTAHRADQERSYGLMFGRTAEQPFSLRTVAGRADRTWKSAGLKRITPHEARHSFASLMIAAGVNAKALSTFMGHANISITLDRYGHLFPGAEDEAAVLLNDYLSSQLHRAAERARAAEPSKTGAFTGAPLAPKAGKPHG